jgi:hypothetical protein
MAKPWVLTIVSVSGPAEVPESSVAQLEGGLIALPQGGTISQGECCVLGTPVGDEAILLAPGGGRTREDVSRPA